MHMCADFGLAKKKKKKNRDSMHLRYTAEQRQHLIDVMSKHSIQYRAMRGACTRTSTFLWLLLRSTHPSIHAQFQAADNGNWHHQNKVDVSTIPMIIEALWCYDDPFNFEFNPDSTLDVQKVWYPTCHSSLCLDCGPATTC